MAFAGKEQAAVKKMFSYHEVDRRVGISKPLSPLLGYCFHSERLAGLKSTWGKWEKKRKKQSRQTTLKIIAVHPHSER